MRFEDCTKCFRWRKFFVLYDIKALQVILIDGMKFSDESKVRSNEQGDEVDVRYGEILIGDQQTRSVLGSTHSRTEFGRIVRVDWL